MLGDWNFQAFEQGLLVQAILRNLERGPRRTNGRQLRQGRESLARDVLPVESQYIARLGELIEERSVLERADEARRHLRAGSIGAPIEERAADPQGIPGEGQHAPQLSSPDDTDARNYQG
jgi:hypothetical protein